MTLPVDFMSARLAYPDPLEDEHRTRRAVQGLRAHRRVQARPLSAGLDSEAHSLSPA